MGLFMEYDFLVFTKIEKTWIEIQLCNDQKKAFALIAFSIKKVLSLGTMQRLSKQRFVRNVAASIRVIQVFRVGPHSVRLEAVMVLSAGSEQKKHERRYTFTNLPRLSFSIRRSSESIGSLQAEDCSRPG